MLCGDIFPMLLIKLALIGAHWNGGAGIFPVEGLFRKNLQINEALLCNVFFPD